MQRYEGITGQHPIGKYILYTDHLIALAEKDKEINALKRLAISMRDYRYVDATPNDDLPIRILSAYTELGSFTDNTLGIPPENPICKFMNELQEKRNAILQRAIETIQRSPR